MASPSAHPLPLPVARLQRRSFNAKSAKDRHDTAYFAWEVSVRIAVAAAPPANAAALSRASVGQWCSALKPKDRPLADAALLALFAALTEGATGARSERKSLAPRDLLDALPAYRNKVIGHGSARQPSFYEDAGRALLAGLDVAWREQLFLPADAKLVHVDSVALDATGARSARALDLSTETPVLLDANGTSVPDTVLPRRLYLRSSDGWRALHPWLLFDEETERLWCFNGLGRRAEYLDYAAGETLAGAELERAFPGAEAALRALVGATDAPAEAAPDTASADEHRFGDYEVLGKLGEGGMGAVFLARQTSLGRTVAVKMLPKERASDAVAVGRFQREIKALARCEHANVVKILASGEARGTHYYAMEFVDGADLAKVAKALSSSPDFGSAVSSAFEAARGERAELFPGLPQVLRRPAAPTKGQDRWRQMARFFAQAARGLAHLHENGIVHRDISPGNVMVTWPDERAVIMDLGLAAVENASVTLTKDKSAILGTLRYIAPEQLQRNLLEIDRRVDVYSLGATMYELIAGQPIFDGETEPRLIQQVLREEPRLLQKVEARVPLELAWIVHKAIDKEPERRYASAAELAADLEAFLAGEPIRAQAPTLAYRAKRWARRHKELVIGSTAGVILAGAVLAWSIHSARRASEATRVALLRDELEALQKDAPASATTTGARRTLMESWVQRARALVADDGATPVLDELRAELDTLRARGKPLPEAEREARRSANERFARLPFLTLLLGWKESVLAAREGRSEPRFDESLAEREAGPKIESCDKLNELAWRYVSPFRSQLEQEMIGLVLARRALANCPEDQRARVRDTLAWALLAAGRGSEAIEQAAQAVAEAASEDREELQLNLRRIEALHKEACSQEQLEVQRHELEVFRANVLGAARQCELETTIAFDDPADGQRHETLVAVVRGLETLQDPVVGKLPRIAGWLEQSGELQQRTVTGPDAQARWSRSIADIQASNHYGGLVLAPQLGLVPLGPDPATGLHEFAFVPTGEPARRDGNGRLQTNRLSALVLVLLPGGRAWLGEQSQDPTADNYGPDVGDACFTVHAVELDPFFIGKCELTQAQWERVTGRNPSHARPGRMFGDRILTDRNPVEDIDWKLASETLLALGLDLPTESQWEYAARGGTSTTWWFGSEPDPLADAGNVRDASYCAASPDSSCEPWDDGWATHAPVGLLRANPFGLHDVCGNVSEWCRDVPALPDAEATGGEGVRPGAAGTRRRALRGGNWAGDATWARSALRDADEPDYHKPTIGVRPMRRIEGAWSTSDGRSSKPRD